MHLRILGRVGGGGVRREQPPGATHPPGLPRHCPSPCGLPAVRSQLDLGFGVSGDVVRSSGEVGFSAPHIPERSQAGPCCSSCLDFCSFAILGFYELASLSTQEFRYVSAFCLNPFKMPLTGGPLGSSPGAAPRPGTGSGCHS